MDVQKIFVYEGINNDKGMIITDSLEKAKQIFREKYPNFVLIDANKPYTQTPYENAAYVYEFEHSEIKPNTLYALIPW